MLAAKVFEVPGLRPGSADPPAPAPSTEERLRDEVARLRALVYRDELTGLGNRRYLEERLAEEIRRARREVGYRFSLVMLDVVGFTRIKEAFGLRRGDEVLCEVARFVQLAAREQDVCCRFGGDALVVLMPGLDAAECADAVTRLRAQARALLPALRLSIGHAAWFADGFGVRALLDAADRAMYADKRRNHDKQAHTPPRHPPRTMRVCFAGQPHETPVQAVRCGAGVRLHSPLPGLRAGAELQLAADDDPPRRARVVGVSLHGAADDDGPYLAVDVEPLPVEGDPACAFSRAPSARTACAR